ncbi:hypothetical protein FB567DRAFT_553225 [Paraphoma chrysanthemicola]|uniref:Uncharacterized protein n=1 Tax=Paraphoma chrysanthemicola TaxID=798071 RepID=A0A8K0VUY7_9PLEO|nr:hypothetical protein FB567DRAFT_553225 [Paraphoma chrysanthemicola]
MRSSGVLLPLFLALGIAALADSKHRSDDVAAPTSIGGPGLGPGGNQRPESTHQSSSQLPSFTIDVSAASIPTDRKSFTPKATSTTQSTSSTTQPLPSSKTTTSASAPASTSAVPQLDLCWASKVCSAIIQDLESCLDKLMPVYINDPESVNEAKGKFQTCLCNEPYKNILDMYAHNTTSTILECYTCIRQADIDIDATNLPPAQFRQKTSDFCNSDQPNLFEELLALLYFTQYGRNPDEKGLVRPIVSTITNFFTAMPGMNRPTTTPTGTPTATDGQWWESSLTQSGLIPTQYLAQLPQNWPYTAYAIRRTAGPVTSWPLTHPITTSKTVAWVYHSVLGNPRPIYTPKAARSANGTFYDPALANWTHGFLYETVTTTAGGSTMAKMSSPARVTGNRFAPAVTQSGLVTMETLSKGLESKSSAGFEASSIDGTEKLVMMTQAALDGGRMPIGPGEVVREWSRLLDEIKSLESRLGG